jgi:hypothetical protein
LNLGLCGYKVGILLLEPQFWFILLSLSWRWGLANYLSALALSRSPLDLSLPSRWDYRREPPARLYYYFKNKTKKQKLSNSKQAKKIKRILKSRLETS